jgi:uncharacterized membrane protein YdjX (TVP38/TMEM64 family)
MEKKKLIKHITITLLIIFAILITLSYLLNRNISLTDIQDYVKSYGALAPLVLFVMIIIASSIGFIFQIPVAVAGLLLNPWMAFFISLAGLTIGAIISFSIARIFARDYVEKRFVKKLEKLKKYDEHLKKRGFITVLIFRLIAIIPYELINIAGGLSRVKASSFLLATIIGIIPGTAIAVYFAKTTQNIESTEFLVAMIINIAFSLTPLLFKKVRRIVFSSE